jgi:hypothetical protein
VTVVDNLIGRAVKAFSSPFAVEEIEVEAALVVEGKPTPSLAHVEVSLVSALRVDEL